MPYKVVRSGASKWKIMKKENGKWVKVGESDTKREAQASIRARYANEK